MPRRPSIDLLRGLVMVIMALDHTRDFVHAGAMAFQPEDLARTTPIIFMTRWITHFCAPAFMFTAGLGAWLRLERDGSRARLARFLFTRGLWLLLLEVTAIRFAFFFNITTSPIFLLVFWSIGMSLIALSLLVWLPYWATFAVSAAMVLFHNLIDPIRAESMGASAWLWRLLHQPGPVTMDPLVIVGYPLIPWIGVMGLGFCAGRIYRLPDDERRSVLFWLGLGLTVAFVALRLTNFYGDPRPWSPQPRPGFTLLSFLNTTKYPVSLQFLLMTLGPALMFLSWVDRARPGDRNPLLVFGRTPLLYFVLHLITIHLFAIGLTWLRYGSAPFLWTPPPTLGTPRDVFPADYGWPLWVAYAVTAAVVLTMYPICLWFSRLKARRKNAWLAYL
jgi:uncharacterized membrane protein